MVREKLPETMGYKFYLSTVPFYVIINSALILLVGIVVRDDWRKRELIE